MKRRRRLFFMRRFLFSSSRSGLVFLLLPQFLLTEAERLRLEAASNEAARKRKEEEDLPAEGNKKEKNASAKKKRIESKKKNEDGKPKNNAWKRSELTLTQSLFISHSPFLFLFFVERGRMKDLKERGMSTVKVSFHFVAHCRGLFFIFQLFPPLLLRHHTLFRCLLFIAH